MSTINISTKKIQGQFQLSSSKLCKISAGMEKALQQGLQGSADLPMIASHITEKPTGTEKGVFMAIDLGGTNVRLWSINVSNPKQSKQKYKILEVLKQKPASELFDFIAQKLLLFIKDQSLDQSDAPIKVGFTFSFPINQTSINRGTLIQWNKGFMCTGAVNQDVVELMEEAIKRANIKAEISCIINDTTGTLLASLMKHKNSCMGVIFGTGTNAAYYEDCKNIKSIAQNSGKMIINTEWGNFDTKKEYLPYTSQDTLLDQQSQNPNSMIFEKMISGKYLGEIVRQILISLIKDKMLFRGLNHDQLFIPYIFETSYMSEIVQDESLNFIKATQILEDLGIKCDKEEVYALKLICQSVGERSALLSSTAVAALLKRQFSIDYLRENQVSIGIDGSLFKLYPGFDEKLREGLSAILGAGAAKNVELNLVEDGSGIGAALAAMTTEFHKNDF